MRGDKTCIALFLYYKKVVSKIYKDVSFKDFMVSRLKKIIASTSLVSGLVGGSLALTGQYFLTNNQKTQIIEVSQQKEKENVIVKPIKKEPYFRNCNNY